MAFLPYLVAYVMYCLFGWVGYIAVVSAPDELCAECEDRGEDNGMNVDSGAA